LARLNASVLLVYLIIFFSFPQYEAPRNSFLCKLATPA
jgi:hypothetical protein